MEVTPLAPMQLPQRSQVSPRSKDSIPKFARTELTLGRLVGKGGFSLVFEVVKLEVEEVYDISKRSASERREVAKESIDENGMPRFAVKMLRDDLIDEEHSKGVIDLAVEARFLRRLSHPNIIAMRATANSDPLESRFFIVLEVLHSTLEERLPEWRRKINSTRSMWCGPMGYCCVDKDAIQATWLERIGIARCIASALNYLHKESIIYRDLKPENVGFDPDGQVKIFDFGLSKRLLPDDRTANGLYRLTGNTGSLRYMAPEVALNQSYNTKADSYSFAIVLWQLCSLTVPYAGYNVRMHADLVVGKGHRPHLHRSWPLSWGALMQACWSSDIEERFDFDRILAILDDEYQVSMSWRGASFSDIRAKKRNKVELELDPKVEKKLDADTRRAVFEPGDFEMTGQHHDIDII